MTPQRSTFAERAAQQIATPSVGRAIAHAMDVRAGRTAHVFDGADLPTMRAAAAAIRDHTLASLPEYLERFAANAEARGTRVFLAADSEEATGYIRRLVRERGAGSIVKGKSMVTEEIDLNAALAADGIEVVETDLGEYIVQLAGERPAHITVPAVHRSRGEIRELFERVHGVSLPDDAEALTHFARGVLRERFLVADVGITGVNFAVAETGSLVVVENEGNVRMSASLPRVHVAVMGIERIVPSFRELAVLLPLLTGSATGQRVTGAVNVISGPRGSETDGPEELHVVIVDNGRSAILGTELAPVLRCIRCGACQNVCPVFRQVGGHAYGGVYGGPIGAVLTPLLEGIDDLPHASSLCAACTQACPVEIPLHEQLLALRRRYARERAGLGERLAFRLWGWAWSSPGRYAWTARLGRIAQVPLARHGRIRRAPFPFSRWTDGRDLPPIAARSFRERWRSGGGS